MSRQSHEAQIKHHEPKVDKNTEQYSKEFWELSEAQKIARAELGDAVDQRMLGTYYGENKDYKNAMVWWEKASTQSDPGAKLILFQIYINHPQGMVRLNEAVPLLSEAVAILKAMEPSQFKSDMLQMAHTLREKHGLTEDSKISDMHKWADIIFATCSNDSVEEYFSGEQAEQADEKTDEVAKFN